jgi:DNA repair photolyase
VLVKANAIDLLRKELSRKRVKGTIGLGSMNDPYMPLEKKINLTGQALKFIAVFHFPVHAITKSDLVLRDLDTLIEINRVYAAVSFTITTADDELGKKVEPGAPLVSDRLKAMQVLAEHGIHTGITMMPILPYIEDNEENIAAIVQQAHQHGAAYILPSFGMTLRDRQRLYYYQQLDKLFPGLRRQYIGRYGNQYSCVPGNVERLANVFYECCEKYGLANRMKQYAPQTATQLSLL